jgi:Zn-dependent M28 family amino/carboxypeptidase
MGILQNLLFKSIHNYFSAAYFDYKDSDLSNPMIDFESELLIFSKRDFIEKIFTLNGHSLKKTAKLMKKGQFKPVPFSSSLEISYSSVFGNVNCKNISAVLPGSDPVLSSEYVILSAHLDHLGIGKPVKKDSVYNGAWDNASGSATLLAIAEAYKQLPVPPKRSVIFLWVTGEEKGLLGSHYFANKPTVDPESLRACMSLDMPGGLFEAKDIIPMGYKMSNLSQAVDFAAVALNLEKDTASDEEIEYFERSDHFSFIKAGIPSLFVMGGMNAVDPKIKGEKIYKSWERKLYHSPFDDMNQEFSREAFLQGIRVNFLISWYISNEMEEIKWKTESKQYLKYMVKKE